jgi:hypothetical protein
MDRRVRRARPPDPSRLPWAMRCLGACSRKFGLRPVSVACDTVRGGTVACGTSARGDRGLGKAKGIKAIVCLVHKACGPRGNFHRLREWPSFRMCSKKALRGCGGRSSSGRIEILPDRHLAVGCENANRHTAHTTCGVGNLWIAGRNGGPPNDGIVPHGS